MPKDSIQLSPRFALALANLKILRLVSKVFEEEGGTNVRQLLKHLEDLLKNKIDQVKSWETEIENDALYFWPGRGWNVLGHDEDGIAIAFDFKYAKEPWISGHNPWAGVYTPYSWAKGKIFREKLRKEVSAGFLDNWEGTPEPEWPIWAYIDLAQYAKEDTFDLDGLLSSLEQRAKDLVRLQPIIDKVIKQIP